MVSDVNPSVDPGDRLMLPLAPLLVPPLGVLQFVEGGAWKWYTVSVIS